MVVLSALEPMPWFLESPILNFPHYSHIFAALPCKHCYNSNIMLHMISCKEHEEISFLFCIQARVISIYFAFHNAWACDLRIFMKYASLSDNSVFWIFGHLSLLPSLQSPSMHSQKNFPKVIFSSILEIFIILCVIVGSSAYLIGALLLVVPLALIGSWISASLVCCLWPSI